METMADTLRRMAALLEASPQSNWQVGRMALSIAHELLIVHPAGRPQQQPKACPTCDDDGCTST